jgi:hypothetical protein
MADIAGTTDRVIDLEVTIIVPGDGRDAIAASEAEAVEGVRQLASAAETVRVSVAMRRIVAGDGTYLATRKEAVRMPQDR